MFYLESGKSNFKLTHFIALELFPRHSLKILEKKVNKGTQQEREKAKMVGWVSKVEIQNNLKKNSHIELGQFVVRLTQP